MFNKCKRGILRLPKLMFPVPEIICSSIGLNTDSSNRVKPLSSRLTSALLKSPVN